MPITEKATNDQYQEIRDKISALLKECKATGLKLGETIDKTTDLFIVLADDVSQENYNIGLECKRLEKEVKALKAKRSQGHLL